MLFWVGLALVWLGAAASTAFLALYLCTARWWDTAVGLSLVSHAAAMCVLFVTSAVLSSTAGPDPVHPWAFFVVAGLTAAEVLQAAVFYRRWLKWRKRRMA